MLAYFESTNLQLQFKKSHSEVTLPLDLNYFYVQREEIRGSTKATRFSTNGLNKVIEVFNIPALSDRKTELF